MYEAVVQSGDLFYSLVHVVGCRPPVSAVPAPAIRTRSPYSCGTRLLKQQPATEHEDTLITLSRHYATVQSKSDTMSHNDPA